MASWTKLTYGKVADLLYRLKPLADKPYYIERIAQWEVTVLAFSKMFEGDNPNFKKIQFHRACSLREDHDI